MDFEEELKTLRNQMDFDYLVDIPENVQNIVIAGMGGSGIAGRIFREIYEKRPVVMVDGYDIPDFVNHKTLFIAISYSGNTEETIAAARKAKIRGAVMKAITSGGKLANEVKDAIIVPSGLQPRSSIGYLLVPLLKGAGFGKQDFQEAKELLGKMDENNTSLRAIASEIMERRRIPVIYGTPPFREVAYRWKTQFNENSKLISYWSYFPELNHNDTMALENDTRKNDFYFMVLESKFADERTKLRIDITSKLCSVEFKRIEGEGKSMVSQLFTLIHKGDYISYHLAKLRNVDPRDVSVIEKLKAELEK